VTQVYDNALRPSGLRSTQFNILAEIHGAGATTITRLAKILIMDQTTLTRNLALLERKGLLKFVPAEDGRVKSAELTKKGLIALVKAQPLWAAAQEKMLRTIGPVWHSLKVELERLAQQEKSPV
jgi:DNA-binding MarR family transcriptional regulator